MAHKQFGGEHFVDLEANEQLAPSLEAANTSEEGPALVAISFDEPGSISARWKSRLAYFKGMSPTCRMLSAASHPTLELYKSKRVSSSKGQNSCPLP